MTNLDHGPVRPDEWNYYVPLVGESMLELGDKINPAWTGEYKTYKEHFEARGFRHVSIDWNGNNGAIARDLREPLWQEFGQFDMVTNIGTTEHVEGPGAQRAVWENIWRMTKPGGVIVSVTPYPDGLNWWWHGTHYPTRAFFKAFAMFNFCEIERIGTDLEPPNKNLYVRMRKRTDAETPSLDPFDSRDFVPPPRGFIKQNKMMPRAWTPPEFRA
jgi:SAM-dependent methyltransferase